MEHIDVSNQSLAAQEAEIYRFVIRTTDLKEPVASLSAYFYISVVATRWQHVNIWSMNLQYFESVVTVVSAVRMLKTLVLPARTRNTYYL